MDVIGDVVGRGLLTAVRVFVMTALSTQVWIPIGVWIGLRLRAAQLVQPLAQFATAFPGQPVVPDGRPGARSGSLRGAASAPQLFT
jgi:NitT/TauT family transport system permease protein